MQNIERKREQTNRKHVAGDCIYSYIILSTAYIYILTSTDTHPMNMILDSFVSLFSQYNAEWIKKGRAKRTCSALMEREQITHCSNSNIQ